MPTSAVSSPLPASDRLAAVDDDRLTRLGFRDDDRRDALAAIERALTDAEALAVVDTIAAGLRVRIGDFDGEANPFAAYTDEVRERADADWGIGVLPLLALLTTADDVAAFHAGRGIGEDISWGTLADLGQQAWVHRRTYGAFGLHTFGWMAVGWSGALYWLGRLQFNLTHSELSEADGGWVISTHIPESGPLTPERVADSFGRARAFFARYFPDYPTTQFHCASWLLDPQLTEDTFVTGVDVRPGNPEVVHHVILYEVPPEHVDEAEDQDAVTSGQGWTCFGRTGMGGGRSMPIGAEPTPGPVCG